jgi:hypothetical protein
MPTPDASQFTQLKKYTAAQARNVEGEPQNRRFSRLYQRLPLVTGPTKFLASFSNKFGFTNGNRDGSGSVSGSGGGNPPDPVYLTTNVTNASFIGAEVSFNKTILATSPFSVSLSVGDRSTRFGHYFNLNSLDPNYTYTFEIIEAVGNTGDVVPYDDTVIALFDNQTIPFSSPPISSNDDISTSPLIRKSKLSDQNVGSNYCLVVAFFRQTTTGSFTLKITRVSYLTTNVTNASFIGDEVTFDKTLESSSPYNLGIEGSKTNWPPQGTDRYGHYFNLNGLSSDYLYTFEITDASLNGSGFTNSVGVIALFYSQTLPFTDYNDKDDAEAYTDGTNEQFSITRLIPENWCIVVTSWDLRATGTFTLKITRVLVDYKTTNVTNGSFVGNEVTFDKTISATSPFEESFYYAHYFNLNSLSSDYTYTFETTAADLNSGSANPPTDTRIALFSSQTLPMTPGDFVVENDDIDVNNNNFLSRLTSRQIPGNWCLVVTSRVPQLTGTFTLKITRTSDYAVTDVTDASFINDEVTFADKEIAITSPFIYPLQFESAGTIEDRDDRYGHYFNLNILDPYYTYTFETTAANIPGGVYGDNDTQIVLFRTQTPPFNVGNLEEFNDEKEPSSGLSLLENKTITRSSCLVVTSYDPELTGTFTLKITRTIAYMATDVTDASFINDEVTFIDKEIANTSPFIYPLEFINGSTPEFPTNRYGHYFKLNNLDSSYKYSFETTAANIPGQTFFTNDTQIVLFRTQTPPFGLNDFQEFNDDNDNNPNSSLSLLENKIITSSSSLVVTTYDPEFTGTFTLKITRTPR